MIIKAGVISNLTGVTLQSVQAVVPALDITARYLVSDVSDGVGGLRKAMSFNENEGFYLFAVDGTYSINFGFRSCLSSFATITLNWEDCVLNDDTETTSLDWKQGRLYSTSTGGGISINWNTRKLITNANTTALDWSDEFRMLIPVNEIDFSNAGGCSLGLSTGKIAFHGATPTIKRAGAAQAAVATTAPTNISPYGFSTSAQAAALVTLVNEIRATMVEKGLMKGSA